MDRPELEAWLRLTLTPGVGSDSARRLLAAFGLPPHVFDQTSAALPSSEEFEGAEEKHNISANHAPVQLNKEGPPAKTRRAALLSNIC